MIRVGVGIVVVAALLMGAPAVVTLAAPARPAPAKRAAVASKVAGSHTRVVIKGGPVHLFRPVGYNRRTAGIVVYVHGYYVHVDAAWREHKLGAQFAASRRNALFIAPEAPADGDHASPWTDLQGLITTALRRARLPAPRGPVIVVGHSGAYRTMAPWLDGDVVRNVILVDGLYGNESDFRRWLERNEANQMTLVVKGTAKWADPFVRALPYAVTLPKIPKTIDELTPEERSAKLLSLRSQYGHFELVTDGEVLPLLWSGRTSLPAVKRAGARR